ncbi:NAD(P)/FAD-dependent oxidoreductase [Rhizorhabdus wittichii]|uniref:NAD(P)/FAD-dependent oxidoreductase n=1 Tax=Rhizorhabdus wittichii TaxID=160791 RepID=UPI0002FDC701|nr:FAD-dependent oxidoreductase [Rhizorhabdus wittichii]
MTRKTFAIVGASLAGAHAAFQLRKDGFDGEILLIGDEAHLPYDRPPLSKAFLLGKAGEDALLLRQESDYSDAAITPVLSTRIASIDRSARSLETTNGRSISFDKLLICTGARARDLPFAPEAQANIHTLRSLDDAARVRAELLPGRRIVVIGFGFIGAEVAAAAQELGCAVTLVEASEAPMQRVLGSEGASRYCGLHASRGIDIRLSTSVLQIREAPDGSKLVVLSDGSELACDAVVYGIGSTPNCEFAQASGLEIANGIAVNAFCETSVEGIYAAGDVAARPTAYASGLVRLESWQNAYRQAVAAARSMLGHREAYDDIPWFWSDQYESKMQLAGLPGTHDQIVWHDQGEDGFSGTAFYFTQRRLTAVLGLNRPRDVRFGMEVVKAGGAVTPDDVRSEGFNIQKYMKR